MSRMRREPQQDQERKTRLRTGRRGQKGMAKGRAEVATFSHLSYLMKET
jgi:hypothetical protein